MTPNYDKFPKVEVPGAADRCVRLDRTDVLGELSFRALHQFEADPAALLEGAKAVEPLVKVAHELRRAIAMA